MYYGKNKSCIGVGDDQVGKWFAGNPFLGKEEKRVLFEIGCRFKNKMETLYQIYGAIAAGDEHFCDSERSITYERKKSNKLLTCNGETLVLAEGQLKTVLSGIIDIMEHVLPLGSVVDLKKDFLKNVIGNTDKVEEGTSNATSNVDKLVVADKSFFNDEGEIDWDKYAPNGGFLNSTRVDDQILDTDTIFDR